jgi:DNA adenine methylase
MKPSRRKQRPPFKTHGGKAYLSRRIVAILPEHDVYVEPYLGGGNVLLNKPRSRIEVGGDLDPELINFWRVLQGDLARLLARIRDLPYQESTFHWARDTQWPEDPVERAVRFLVRNRFSRGGLGKNFAWSKRLRGGRPGDSNAWETLKQELPLIAARIQDVRFLRQDGIETIKQFDGPHTVIYLDPPYLMETRSAPNTFMHEMSFEDHERLLKTIIECRGFVAISGYQSPLYDRYLKNWDRTEWEMPNHSGQTKQKERRLEVLWTNGRTPSGFQ